MLKIKTSLVITILSFAFLAQAESANSETEKQVRTAFQSLVDASKKLDAQNYFQHFDAEKFVGLNSNGTNWNSIDDLTPLITSGFGAIEKVISLEFPNLKVSVIDNYTAILVNEYSQTMLLKDGNTISVSGGGTQVWSKRSGEWKLVSVSASNK